MRGMEETFLDSPPSRFSSFRGTSLYDCTLFQEKEEGQNNSSAADRGDPSERVKLPSISPSHGLDRNAVKTQTSGWPWFEGLPLSLRLLEE